ncbi:receptor-type tyrosine-protein phosphatase H [Bombina bombina]|uniref:receptor-type tyrosine-protein phosphatase H n=1 Tax=Bombina bombina TaxID=8345 RepID=UPI00235AE65B|nr:receptor-type tyrosine-protein phosphatase H [Bombina bombina]
MAFPNISPREHKSLFPLLLAILIWHGGTEVMAQSEPSTVSSLNVTGYTDISVELLWTNPNETNSSTYKYNILASTSNIYVFNQTTEANATHYNVTGLNPGVNYHFQVFTVSASDVSSKDSANTSQTTRPSTVSKVNVTARTTTTISLSWAVPNDINTATYVYNITVNNGSSSWEISTKDNKTQITSLLPGVNYAFKIYTVTSDDVTSMDFVSIRATTEPSAVTNVTVTAKTTTTISLSWAVPNDINTATYVYKIIVNNGSSSWENSTKDNQTQITSLLPGVNYTFNIYTVTSDNVTSVAFGPIPATTKPSAVTNVTVTAKTTTTISLSWKIPNDINTATYVYKIIVNNGSSSWENSTKDNKTQITSLLPGVNYTFNIYTVTSNNVTSVAFGPIPATTEPSTVSNVTVTARTTTTISLSWKIPNDINTATYVYKIAVNNGSSSWENSTKDNKTQITSLLPGVNYTFNIYTVTSDNVTSVAFGPIPATTEPSAVSNVNVTARTTTTISLSWTVPNDINRVTYVYKITVNNGSSSWENSTKDNKTQITSLLPGVNYTFNIYTVTSDNVTSVAFGPIPATTIPSVVADIQLVSRNTSSITINWTNPHDNRVSLYKFSIQIILGSSNNTYTSSNNYFTAENLLPGTQYNFFVQSVIDELFSAYMNNSFYSIPNQPLNVAEVTANTSALSLTWTAPNDPNKDSYNYKVVCTDQKQNIACDTLIMKDTVAVISNLKPGTLYNVTVNSEIENAYSTGTQKWLQTNPLSPESLSIDNITNSTVVFKWKNPNYSEGHVTGFQLETETNKTITKINVTNIAADSYELTGLVPGSNYSFTLRSYTINIIEPGTRIFRREVGSKTITTFSAAITQRSQMEPNMVTQIYCKSLSAYKVEVDFHCPSGAYTNFIILVNGQERVVTSNCGPVTVDDLSAAQGYEISVRTVAFPKFATNSPISCNTDSTGVIVGSIFGVLLFLLLVGLIAFFVLKKRRLYKGEPSSSSSLPFKRFPTPITKEDFTDYFNKQHADSDFGFAEEYQQLSSVGTNQAKTAAENPANRAKNRFTNVVPYDHSRVKLSCIEGDSSSDYINANYMPGFNSGKEFIATQGPLPNTTGDFWRMIWEHQINTIVMLTNCMENGRVKCERYWPLDYTPCTYDDITVTVTSETILTDWTIRDFSLKHAKQQDIKDVRHYHYTAWPDHNVPENTTTIIKFRSLVRDYLEQRKSNGPCVVHCSAGVGRTGTLIALDYLIQQMEKEHRIGTYNFVQKMRMNRGLMVQTESQYVFLNKCMLDLIEQPAEENIYENQLTDLIYENASAVREFQRQN